MSKHRNADEKLVSVNLRKLPRPTSLGTPSDNSAPQLGKVGTNSKNQYR